MSDRAAILVQGIASAALDASATLPLAHVRDLLDQALAAYGDDPRLRRAFIHSIGAIDDSMRQQRAWPNRQTRRQDRGE